jgi:hypothetical protein
MRKITGNSIGHNLSTTNFPKSKDFICPTCATRKMILRPSHVKIKAEPLKFLEKIQGDIWGPIMPTSESFRYFMVLIDASTRWSHVCLLSTRSHAFAKIMSQIIKLKANFPEHRINSIWMDNATEFTSQAFNDYCMALGIQVQHSVPYVHTQNGLAKSLMKRIKLISRPLLMNCKLSSSCWGHATLHAADLIQLRPTAYHSTSPIQMVHGNPPSISHLHKLGCCVYIPISPPQRTAMSLDRKVGIYVGFQSPSIIKYLEPLIGDLFTAHFTDSIFVEEHFSALGGDFKYQKECQEINWNTQSGPGTDPRTTETELQVQKIIHLQRLANELPDAFTNYKGVTKSIIPARNAPERVEVPSKTTQLLERRSMVNKRYSVAKKQRTIVYANKHQNGTMYRVDCDDPRPSSDVHITEAGTSENPRHINLGISDESLRSDEIAINYVETGETYDRKATNVDIYFSEKIAEDLQNDLDPNTMAECTKRSDWIKWKTAIEAELASLYKREVFSAVMPTPRDIFPVGYKWVFIRK